MIDRHSRFPFAATVLRTTASHPGGVAHRRWPCVVRIGIEYELLNVTTPRRSPAATRH